MAEGRDREQEIHSSSHEGGCARGKKGSSSLKDTGWGRARLTRGQLVVLARETGKTATDYEGNPRACDGKCRALGQHQIRELQETGKDKISSRPSRRARGEPEGDSYGGCPFSKSLRKSGRGAAPLDSWLNPTPSEGKGAIGQVRKYQGKKRNESS